MALADCDGGGVSNIDECNAGGDPFDPNDDTCENFATALIDHCAYILLNPTSPLATADCDGGGVSNIDECNAGGDPFDPNDDTCDNFATALIDHCAYILLNPTSPLATADCDGGGVNNIDECNAGGDPFDPNDDSCDNFETALIDHCAYILLNPSSPMATADCDGGGVSNIDECNAGGDPFDPNDDSCDYVAFVGLDMCAYISLNPNSPLATADCDGGGVNNIDECNAGGDPFDPNDDSCDYVAFVGLDICAYISLNPNSPLATADCDGGGVSNIDECNAGGDPFDPIDDTCDNFMLAGIDHCAYILLNPSSPMATADCDGSGVNNIDECNSGGDPFDPIDDTCDNFMLAGTDHCAYILLNPTSPLATADCDGGGVNNIDECNSGGDPFDPVDDSCDLSILGDLDLCDYLESNPGSPLSTLDCDGGGVDNATECENGGDPLYGPDDDCINFATALIDHCAYVLAHPLSPIALADCDGGGVSNIDECNSGGDPFDPNDDTCDNFATALIDHCAYILLNPTSPIALADCDGGGVSNIDECNTGGDPFDPNDDSCDNFETALIDHCAYILLNPSSPMATADCDGGGVNNIDECNSGGDPFDPIDDTCDNFMLAGIDHCAYILLNPTSPLATADCDGGGVNNIDECNTGGDPFDPVDDSCDLSILGDLDLCDYLESNPGSPLSTLDCDGGGVDNATECENGGDPLYGPDDDCINFETALIDHCAYVLAHPLSPIALADCDGGGVSNIDECNSGGDPFDPNDDTCDNFATALIDHCAYVLAHPLSPMALADCDGGGVSNIDECNVGGDPFDPNDDTCENFETALIDHCAYILLNSTSPLATADCDGGGVSNIDECNAGGDPFDPNDDTCENFETAFIDHCAYILLNPTSPLATADCDGGGVSNIDECNSGGDPFDPVDDSCDLSILGDLDLCDYLESNPGSPLSTLDCDGGGVDNATECENGGDPLYGPDDDCINFETALIDHCAYVLAHPLSPMALADCDGGGVSNIDECNTGGDPFDPNDDTCENFATALIDHCAYILLNPTSPMALADCDGGGVSNIDECNTGGDPFDPNDDSCDNFETALIDHCAYILLNPTSPLALADCDGGGVSNIDECNAGGDPFDPNDDSCDNFATALIDHCAYILANPTSLMATADCDGGGVSNIDECNAGGDPFDPIDDTCDNFMLAGIDHCTYILLNPTSPLATADCDGGGVSNIDECNTGGDPFDPFDDSCDLSILGDLDLCDYLESNPGSPLSTLDCDGGGVDNATECENGGDPLYGPDDDCINFATALIDHCAYVLAHPLSPMALADCDGGGVSNIDECNAGGDPFDPNDDSCENFATALIDHCAYISLNPSSPMALADCDGGGVSNIDECNAGGDPFDPNDDTCDNFMLAGIDHCAYILLNPTSPLATADCDGGGVSNIDECNAGGDPFDPNDDSCDYVAFVGLDICAYFSLNPNSPLATADCDGGGVSNIDECNAGGDPFDPNDDSCDNFMLSGIDHCAYILLNPTSPLATADCDGGGVNNIDECNSGGDPFDPVDDSCDLSILGDLDLCDYLESNPDSPLSTLDCDGGGVDNATECENGGDPLYGPDDDCINFETALIDHCAYVLAHPLSPIALADCDGGGVSNIDECNSGGDPFDPNDDTCDNFATALIDHCAYVLAHPLSPMALADCDGGGVSNIDECNVGGDPFDPNDDTCENFETALIDHCAYILLNSTSPLATADCDGGGVSNIDECNAGGDPFDPNDDTCENFETAFIDHCAYILLNPTSPLATADCDGGGVSNIDECNSGGDPFDPVDDSCDLSILGDLDLCDYLESNPDSPLSTLDCDGGGVDNATECENGGDPLYGPDDDCINFATALIDHCAYILLNPTSPMALADCDGGGVSNIDECNAGGDPFDPNDDTCENFETALIDHCAYISLNPSSPMALADCDGGGVSNIDECNAGGDPFDPNDDTCDNFETALIDHCAYILLNPTSPLATADCDGGGVNNIDECNAGGDPFDPNDDSCDNFETALIDHCAYILLNPSSPMATADCDGGGVNNIDECNSGGDPFDPIDDTCDNFMLAGIDHCAYILLNPTSPLATADCDGGGVNNIDECNTGGDPFDPVDDSCDLSILGDLDLCDYLESNPGSPLSTLDCDGGGIDNATECENGGDPLYGPDDDCINFATALIDHCAYVLAHPLSPMALADCDGGGVSNIDECNAGGDPFDPNDDSCDNFATALIDHCAYILLNPTSPMALADCDGGGVSNIDECNAGGDPFDPNDDSCDNFATALIDHCAYILLNSTSPMALADCDGGGVSNIDECNAGGDPFDPIDDTCDNFMLAGIDHCAYILLNPTSPMATADCDGGGVNNIDECNAGGDPFDPNDDTCENFATALIDHCAYISLNPSSPVAIADCDGGGVSNIDECNSGGDPFDPNDDTCDNFATALIDHCAYILLNPTSPMALADCDGGGVSNIDECNTGGDPFDPNDDSCDNFETALIDYCAYILLNPSSPMATADCDGGGVNNIDECNSGGDPFDPNDDTCDNFATALIDHCAYILLNPTSPIALADCDGGGVSNIDECNTGGDPFDPNDDSCDNFETALIDHCAYILLNPSSPMATADCDGGGVNNIDECNSGGDPFDPNDDSCDNFETALIDHCAYILLNPSSPMATADCDGGGVNNIDECNSGGDPFDPIDDTCDNFMLSGIDHCAYILLNPTSPMALADCDGGGVSNIDECNAGGDPFDPNDDTCENFATALIDHCAYILLNPTSPMALADCDGGGVSNIDECNAGGDPFDPNDDSCDNFETALIDHCAYILLNPTSPLATADCDGGGVNNIDECNSGGDPFDPVDDSCDLSILGDLDLCDYLESNPDSPLSTLDCDGGGVDNATECENGGDPLYGPDDDCMNFETALIDHCAYVLAHPLSPIALADCDGGGVSNIDECNAGGDPFDPNDDTCENFETALIDHCAYILLNPTSPLATADCDGGGVNNIDECNSGGDPFDPNDDSCDNFETALIDHCAYILLNPTSPLATADCDGGGVNNIDECNAGGDPFDPNDDSCDYVAFVGLDMCAYISLNPNSPLATADCDGGGISNIDECNAGGDPFDPNDDSCESFIASSLDICAYLTLNPDSPVATFDCDGGGVSNIEECHVSGDPFDPLDDSCSNFEDSLIDHCAYILANPDRPLALSDCDGGGVNNIDECNAGGDPFDPNDDTCENFETALIDHCAYILLNPTSPLATADCDGGGVSNIDECNAGGDPFDPNDDSCDYVAFVGLDICAYISLNPNSPLATADCDGGGVSNIDECNAGGDPFDPNDDSCESFIASSLDICAYLTLNPDSPVAIFDCDGGGVSNIEECHVSGDPFDPLDDSCSNFEDSLIDHCAYILANPDSPLALSDCDGGGVNNIDECNTGGDLFDSMDDTCENFESSLIDHCAYILLNPTSSMALADCDGGGVNNIDECNAGSDPFDPLDDDLFIDLSLNKSVNLTEVYYGEQVVYTITVSNDGDINATGVDVEDVLPDGLANPENINNNGIYNGLTIFWSDLVIPANSSIDLNFSAIVVEAGSVINNAEIVNHDQIDVDSEPDNGNPTEDDQDYISVEVIQVDLELSKTVNSVNALIGDVLIYTINVSNVNDDIAGLIYDANNVSVLEIIPEQLQLDQVIPTKGSYNPANSTWSIGTINNGATVSLQIIATVINSGDIVNVAEILEVDEPDLDSNPANDDGDQSEDDESAVSVLSDLEGCSDINACNYEPSATIDDGSCDYNTCAGCTDVGACNFNPNALLENGSCTYGVEGCPNPCNVVLGCTDVNACNYNSDANCYDGTCDYNTCAGCTDAEACNYDATATLENGTCTYGDNCDNGCIGTPGCTNPNANNYNVLAICDDGSCDFDPDPDPIFGCTDATACNYDVNATNENGSCTYGVEGCPNPCNVVLGCTDVNACNYNSDANCYDDTCDYNTCAGCTDAEACNYDATATLENGTCTYGDNCDNGCIGTPGCTNPNANNYNVLAICDDGSCNFDPDPDPDPIFGCTDATACNYDVNATNENGSCTYGVEECPNPCNAVLGCTDVNACNYNSDANCYDGSCDYNTCAGCTDADACNFNPNALLENGSCNYGVDGCPNPCNVVLGCIDINACNYEPNADCDNGNCIFGICFGCHDPSACNYEPNSIFVDGTCVYGDSDCPDPCNVIYGCLDPTAFNYDPTANCSVDTCIDNPGSTNGLEGIVWEDTNGNGMQDAGESGIEGVTVTLYDAGTGLPIGTAVTDSSGAYSFDDLPDGSYYTNFGNLLGFDYTTPNVGNDEYDSDANASGQSHIITMIGGDTVASVDAGFVPDGNPSNSLGGSIWEDVDGDGILDATELGIGSVLVSIYNANTGQLLGSTVTDSNGNYSFDNLPDGTYYVVFDGYGQSLDTYLSDGEHNSSVDFPVPIENDLCSNPINCGTISVCTGATQIIEICPDWCISGDVIIDEVESVFQCSIQLLPNGCVAYTPLPGMEIIGSDQLLLHAIFSSGVCATIDVDVVIGECQTNIPPVANDDYVSTNAGSSVVVSILENDYDSDGDNLYVCNSVSDGQPANGLVAFTSTGVVYTPNPGFYGTDTFTYTVCDENGGSDTGIVIITVPQPPQNCDNTQSLCFPIFEAGTQPKEICINFCGYEMSISNLSSTFTCGMEQVSNSCFTYNFLPGLEGENQLIVSGCNNSGECEEVLVNISVKDNCEGTPPSNNNPVAVDDYLTVYTNSVATINVTDNDEDFDGDILMICGNSNPTNGTISIVGSSIIYTPNSGFTGIDAFSYVICDGNNGSDSALVYLTIIADSSNPTENLGVNDDFVTVTCTQNGTSINVYDNDDAIDFNSTDCTFTQPSNGLVIQSGNGFIYYPNANYSGTDLFTYTVCQNGLEEIATVYIIVTCNNAGLFESNKASGESLAPIEMSTDNPCVVERIITPNVVTPNGDGINDVFGINGCKDCLNEGGEISLLIFTLHGQPVYNANQHEILKGWNGKLENSGQNLPIGVYYFRIEIGKGYDVEIMEGFIELRR